MEAKGGNDESEISQKVTYGELSALLNEITSTDSEVKKSDPVSKDEDSSDLFNSEGTSETEPLKEAIVKEVGIESDNIDSELLSLEETTEIDNETNTSLKELEEILKEETSPETCPKIEKEPESSEVSENLVVEPKESLVEETAGKETEKVVELSDSMKEPATLESESLIESSVTLSEETKKIEVAEEVAKEIKEPAKSQRSESPNELISMLQKLSPEKLEVIKSKIFDDKQKKVEFETKESCSKMEVDEEKVPEKIAAKDDDDCVILLDSDEDEPAPQAEKPVEDKVEAEKPVEDKLEPVAAPKSQVKRKVDEDKENNPGKTQRKSKECVNPDCPGECEKFIESPIFILSFYFATKKANKVLFVCTTCFDKAIQKYEELGDALFSNKPLSSVQIHKKHEMVEVIDSDEEDGPNEARFVADEDKICFDLKTELQVESILSNFCKKVDFSKHFDLDSENIVCGLDAIDVQQSFFDEELKKLEKQSSRMYNELYSINRPKIQRRPSLDILHETESRQSTETPPFKAPTGHPTPGTKVVICPPKQVVKAQSPQNQKIVISPMSQTRLNLPPPIPKDQIHYAVRYRIEGKMQNWLPCTLLETTRLTDGTMTYRVQFFDNQVAVVTGKEFAKSNINLGLTIGARVIALFTTKPTKPGIRSKEINKKFLPGVIGEKRSKYNKFRYLVFCDYGQVQYASAEDVREIAEASRNVADDVHRNLKQFIEEYLHSQTQGQRPLLNVRVNMRVSTERNCAWINTTVVEVDCSLVKILFTNDGTFEWIYRGSKRFGPLYEQNEQRGANKNARRNDPFISYINVDSDEETKAEPAAIEAEVNKKNTARKSTAPPPPPKPQQQLEQAQQPSASGSTSVPKTIILNDDNIYLEDPNKVTKHRHFTPRKDIAAKKYVEHKCSPACLQRQGNLASYSPLTKPLLTCWERQIVRQKTNKWIVYKAPCGRRLRNMYEIRRYLIITQCPLNVDNFDFDINMQVLAAYEVADKSLCPLYVPDMSDGKEGMKIPVINAFDDSAPPTLIYSAKRIPMKGVHINTDPEFMACCDCVDDCADKTKCACFQMTIRGFKSATRDENQPDEDISYVWKRLLAPVTTGIYECHSRCKCSSRCLNKVVQQPIQIKMQLYRTKNRGWGLESCHDIPKGTFVCIYAGRLYTEDEANGLCQGLDHGDEYFAELDLIETAAPLKEDFEAGVIQPDSETDEENSDSDYDEKNAEEDGDFMSTAKAKGDREILTRSARNSRTQDTNPSEGKGSNDSDSDADIVNMLPTAGNASVTTPRTGRSLRKLYGKNEKVYIMDAKTCGNVGRYFNHSCDPNLFVQSVFVDTHDMRFPWIAFFAARPIKAGEELTWNYNYEVGSVAGKVLFCKCGGKNCRGRIL